ncbi:MAG: DUF4350 domain-containing protein [Nannocystaceae bacterium]
MITATLLVLLMGNPEVDAEEILRDKVYAFCHDPTYPLSPDEAMWCPHVGETMPRCPALPAACAAPRAEMVESRSGRFVGEGSSAGSDANSDGGVTCIEGSSSGGAPTGGSKASRRKRPCPCKGVRPGEGGGGLSGERSPGGSIGGASAGGGSAGGLPFGGSGGSGSAGASGGSTGSAGAAGSGSAGSGSAGAMGGDSGSAGGTSAGGTSGGSTGSGSVGGTSGGSAGSGSAGSGSAGSGSAGSGSAGSSSAGSGSTSSPGESASESGGTATSGGTAGAGSAGVADTHGATESAGGSASESGLSATGGPSGHVTGDMSSESGPKDDEKKADEKTDDEETDDEKTDDDEADEEESTFSGVAEVLFWVIILLGALILAYAILRNTRREAGDNGDAPDAPKDPDAPATTPALLAGSRETLTLLDRAVAAANAGRYDEAVLLTHAALLCDLDARALIRLDPAFTHGDYLRALRPHPEIQREVKQVLREIEPVFFGATRADAPIVESALGRVKALLQRTAAAASALLLAALTVFACQTYSDYKPFEPSPSGAQGIIELARRHDLWMRVRTDPYLDLADDHRLRTLVLTTAAPTPTDEEWAVILGWVERGNLLIIAGADLPPETPFFWLTEVDAPILPRMTTPETIAIGVDEGATYTTLAVRGDALYAAQIDRGLGHITVVADGRLFTNMSLAFEDDPRRTLDLLGDDGPIELVDALINIGAERPADALANLKVLPLILHLLLGVLVFFLARGVAFGLLRDPPARSRRRFADHLEALGQVYARARATRHAVRLYAAWALDRLRERTAVDRKAGILPLAQAVAARTGAREEEILETLYEAAALRSEDPDAPTPDDIPLMRRLARLLDAFGAQR